MSRKIYIPEMHMRKYKMNNIELINASCVDRTVDVIVNAANNSLWVGAGICEVF